MFIEKVIEVDDPFIIKDLYEEYYDKLSKGEPCYIFNDKGYRIGTIYDISIEHFDKQSKLIAKCELFSYNEIWDKF